MKLRAAVLNEVGQPLAIETIEMGALGPTDVLVRIHASGLCHTDLEVIEGSLAYPLPIVLGHEGAGVVEAVGSDVTSVRAGEHVVCSRATDAAGNAQPLEPAWNLKGFANNAVERLSVIVR